MRASVLGLAFLLSGCATARTIGELFGARETLAQLEARYLAEGGMDLKAQVETARIRVAELEGRASEERRQGWWDAAYQICGILGTVLLGGTGAGAGGLYLRRRLRGVRK